MRQIKLFSFKLHVDLSILRNSNKKSGTDLLIIINLIYGTN